MAKSPRNRIEEAIIRISAKVAADMHKGRLFTANEVNDGCTLCSRLLLSIAEADGRYTDAETKALARRTLGDLEAAWDEWVAAAEIDE